MLVVIRKTRRMPVINSFDTRRFPECNLIKSLLRSIVSTRFIATSVCGTINYTVKASLWKKCCSETILWITQFLTIFLSMRSFFSPQRSLQSSNLCTSFLRSYLNCFFDIGDKDKAIPWRASVCILQNCVNKSFKILSITDELAATRTRQQPVGRFLPARFGNRQRPAAVPPAASAKSAGNRRRIRAQCTPELRV